MHNERDVLVGDAFQRDQRLSRLQFVIERHQLKLPPERAAERVLALNDHVEDLEELIAGGGERAGERIDITDLDRIFRNGRPAHGKQAEHDRGQADAAHNLDHVFPRFVALAGRTIR